MALLQPRLAMGEQGDTLRAMAPLMGEDQKAVMGPQDGGCVQDRGCFPIIALLCGSRCHSRCHL